MRNDILKRNNFLTWLWLRLTWLVVLYPCQWLLFWKSAPSIVSSSPSRAHQRLTWPFCALVKLKVTSCFQAVTISTVCTDCQCARIVYIHKLYHNSFSSDCQCARIVSTCHSQITSQQFFIRLSVCKNSTCQSQITSQQVFIEGQSH